jgi:1,4-alpha-glucan branching enzyme
MEEQMMTGTATKPGKTRVTFEVPAGAAAQTACVCGELNGWAKGANPMKRRKGGSYAVTLQLAPGRYEFRYFLDGERWENEWAADEYVPNEFGLDNSVVEV